VQQQATLSHRIRLPNIRMSMVSIDPTVLLLLFLSDGFETLLKRFRAVFSVIFDRFISATMILLESDETEKPLLNRVFHPTSPSLRSKSSTSPAKSHLLIRILTLEEIQYLVCPSSLKPIDDLCT